MIKPSLLLLFAALSSPSEPEGKKHHDGDDTFVIVMTEHDASTEDVYERYPELSGSWDELAKFNLLRSGRAIRVPRQMLSSEGVLAKVASAYGEAEVKRSFDRRFMPVVNHLLLREGDEIRTWRSSGARILFEDGNYVFVNSQTRVKVVSLGDEHASATSRLQILLSEGSIWSQIENRMKRSFEIRTSSANTIIRGTNFRVKVEPGAVTRLEVIDGTVDFEAGAGPISIGSQHGALATGSGDPITPVALPAPPQNLESPEPQEVIRGEEFDQLFRWTPVAGARAYHLVIAKDRQFFDLVDERRVGPEASVRIPSLEPGTYFWRVSTLGGTGFEGAFSESRYFVFVRRQP